jgi:hypothetical protein
MALVDFTSYDDIRAALGVSTDEIQDSTISLPLYDLNLKSEFEDVSLTLEQDFVDLVATAPTGWTAAEERFVRYTQLFSTYAVAKHLTDSLPLFSPKEISDGKAMQTRFALDPYKATILSVKDRYDRYRARLVAAYEAVQAGSAAPTTARPYFAALAPTSDPVTGT